MLFRSGRCAAAKQRRQQEQRFTHFFATSIPGVPGATACYPGCGCDAAPAHPAVFFFFNDTATTEIYTLSLHDALPILPVPLLTCITFGPPMWLEAREPKRSEEHTSELQSPKDLVCRLLLEKKKKT